MRSCAGSKKANWFYMKFNIEGRLAIEIDFVFPQSNQKLLAVTVQAHCFVEQTIKMKYYHLDSSNHT